MIILKYNGLRVSAIITFLILLSSCKRFVEIPGAPDLVISDMVFESDAKAESTVTAIYGNMINGAPGFSNYLTSIYTGLSSDELAKFNPRVYDTEFMDNSITSGNSIVSRLWSSLYQTIYYTNVIIEGVSNSKKMTDTKKKQLSGECLFIRAFCYFYLVNLFGDVPFETSSDYRENLVKPRTPIKIIYEQIIADLIKAQSLLDVSNQINTRANKWAATALLARIYLYQTDYKNAAIQSSKIISSSEFHLEYQLGDVFLTNSKDIIWQLSQREPYVPEFLNATYPIGGPNVFLTEHLIYSFENGDLRRQKWIDSISYMGTKYYYPGKYKLEPSRYYYVVLRLSEQYLIRSEARANLGDISGAQSDLNYIRNRSGLPNTVADNLASLLSAIEHERQVELFCEWGQRWLDLKRLNQADSELSSVKAHWSHSDVFYPIPQNEIISNPFLVQNNGY